jgi:hypothetical protein
MVENKPKFKYSNLGWYREEKEGYWTFIPKYHPETRELVINRTSKDILNFCDGCRTIQQIEEEMNKKYPDASTIQIKNDISKMLSKFSRLGVIEWDGENPFLERKEEPINEEFSMVIAQEDNLMDILNFLKDSQNYDKDRYYFYANPVNVSAEYSELELRHKLFSFKEEFFLVKNKKKVVGLISIAMPKLIYFCSALIKNIVTPSELIEDHINYSIDNLLFLSVNEVIKIELFEDNSTILDDTLKKILLNNNFVEEAYLKNELGFDKDLRIYSWFYKKETVDHVRAIKKLYK